MLLFQLIIITNQVTSKNFTIWCGVWVVNNNVTISINNNNKSSN